MLAIGMTPLLVGAVAAVVYLIGPSEPSVAITPPAGYQAITDAYWGYAIPAGWTQDSAYTDSNGDFFYRGTGGWAAETLRIRAEAPTLDEAPPSTLASFGQLRPSPYQLIGGARATVPGADAAWSYTLVRGSTTARVLDAWVRSSKTEIWLVVQADPQVSATVVSSLRA